METARIAELLAPFTGEETLTPLLLEQLQRYLDLLLRWNARVNLTAVRDPETIVTRHFGESLFAARVLLDATWPAGSSAILSRGKLPPKGEILEGDTKLGRGLGSRATLIDVGSGAGFPGIPIKLFAPHIKLTLIESHSKKAVFLREPGAPGSPFCWANLGGGWPTHSRFSNEWEIC